MDIYLNQEVMAEPDKEYFAKWIISDKMFVKPECGMRSDSTVVPHILQGSDHILCYEETHSDGRNHSLIEGLTDKINEDSKYLRTVTPPIDIHKPWPQNPDIWSLYFNPWDNDIYLRIPGKKIIEVKIHYMSIKDNVAYILKILSPGVDYNLYLIYETYCDMYRTQISHRMYLSNRLSNVLYEGVTRRYYKVHSDDFINPDEMKFLWVPRDKKYPWNKNPFQILLFPDRLYLLEMKQIGFRMDDYGMMLKDLPLDDESFPNGLPDLIRMIKPKHRLNDMTDDIIDNTDGINSIIDFLEVFVNTGERISGKDAKRSFGIKFLDLFRRVYPIRKSYKKNINRTFEGYGLNAMNKELIEHSIPYRIKTNHKTADWTIIRETSNN
jgi:hypothetical protein